MNKPDTCPAHANTPVGETARTMRSEDFPLPASSGTAPCGLTFYRIHSDAPEIRPARAPRLWMDNTPDRFAYRCLPLSIANATGWEVSVPVGLRVSWNGGDKIDDMRVEALKPEEQPRVDRLAGSHFGSGVLTFHTGYVMRTSEGWGLWARGAPNTLKDGIAALDGLIETDWLPFPFTMNWKFTRPGIVTFNEGDVYCFVTPTPHHALEAIEPTMVPLDSDPHLRAEYEGWSEARADFNAKLHAREPEAMKQGWQRNYMHGRMLDGAPAPVKHATKRKLKAPKSL
ncbi:MAG: DUF6065 family protein [Pseudomonadota bacterium]